MAYFIQNLVDNQLVETQASLIRILNDLPELKHIIELKQTRKSKYINPKNYP